MQGLSLLYLDVHSDVMVLELLQDVPPEWDQYTAGRVASFVTQVVGGNSVKFVVVYQTVSITNCVRCAGIDARDQSLNRTFEALGHGLGDVQKFYAGGCDSVAGFSCQAEGWVLSVFFHSFHQNDWCLQRLVHLHGQTRARGLHKTHLRVLRVSGE